MTTAFKSIERRINKIESRLKNIKSEILWRKYKKSVECSSKDESDPFAGEPDPFDDMTEDRRKRLIEMAMKRFGKPITDYKLHPVYVDWLKNKNKQNTA